jgi:glutamate/tyrosine decarboxylase-like PLP-dependent enzyme
MLEETEDDNDFLLTDEFSARYKNVCERYFSRNAEYWPIFKEPGLAHIIQTRLDGMAHDDRLAVYPKGDELYEDIRTENEIPYESLMPCPENKDELLLFAGTLCKNWENPSSVENVITMPSDPAIYGSMLGIVSTPNLVYKEYCGMAEDLERYVVRQMATLAGYDPEQATGIFTQGGTFCNMYGYLLGIRKSMPEARSYGLGAAQDYRFMNSKGGHYSNTTNLSLMGVDLKRKTIRIKVTKSNKIDVKDFELQLESCFRLQSCVPTIMLTMGTTDTFGVDEVKPVYEIRERLCERYKIDVLPHIHVDAAIGWPMIFFLKYDFDKNPLNINVVTLHGLERNVALFKQIKYADSFTIDFQKWGYVPYTSSLVMIKDKNDLKALENDPENFSYFEDDQQGQTHLQSTIECSRGAAGLFGAYSGLHYLGIEGYQTILAHCLQNANYFRHRLHEFEGVEVLVYQNQGPSVAFRIYNPEWIESPAQEYRYEYKFKDTQEYHDRMKRNTDFHRKIFLRRGKLGLYTNWVDFICHTTHDEQDNHCYIPGEKAVFMNPRTTFKEIDIFLERLLAKPESE